MTSSSGPPPPFPEYDWPRLRWRSAFWLSLVPAALAFVLFFYPQLTSNPSLSSARLLIGLPLALLPIIVPLTDWSLRAARCAISRTKNYPHARLAVISLESDLNAIRKAIVDLGLVSPIENGFELAKASISNHKLMIAIRRSTASPLSIGQHVAVVDIQDRLLMGLFRVTEERAAEYYAVEEGPLDPVWAGHVHQHGEVTMFPYLTAVSLAHGGHA